MIKKIVIGGSLFFVVMGSAAILALFQFNQVLASKSNVNRKVEIFRNSLNEFKTNLMKIKTQLDASETEKENIDVVLSHLNALTEMGFESSVLVLETAQKSAEQHLNAIFNDVLLIKKQWNRKNLDLGPVIESSVRMNDAIAEYNSLDNRFGILHLKKSLGLKRLLGINGPSEKLF